MPCPNNSSIALAHSPSTKMRFSSSSAVAVILLCALHFRTSQQFLSTGLIKPACFRSACAPLMLRPDKMPSQSGRVTTSHGKAMGADIKMEQTSGVPASRRAILPGLGILAVCIMHMYPLPCLQAPPINLTSSYSWTSSSVFRKFLELLTLPRAQSYQTTSLNSR